ncbi:MAG TPA: hypothetical protein RMH85_17860 [Polyangiaceae bacterium LLY-WYZ-15_(1-7)]|nr:hypothetical protein [Myxococcales bacterium]MAT29939.1 hypothetical protein [Sandaracinus sp.]HJL05016.1 hypothetical protein [Polyangiaceae bacterium LLY-WYZ-15_(1-7)]HJL10371.1 hypothetical protein [Polyangiaceae bacterium LLY-WYZ-15_(1-7)]HJL24670.1 hypothetical protein [Polyangiaceae bacterium LLY-WYZ-15_(1-7)]
MRPLSLVATLALFTLPTLAHAQEPAPARVRIQVFVDEGPEGVDAPPPPDATDGSTAAPSTAPAPQAAPPAPQAAPPAQAEDCPPQVIVVPDPYGAAQAAPQPTAPQLTPPSQLRPPERRVGLDPAIQARVAELRRQDRRNRPGWPIAFMVMGGVGGGLASVILIDGLDFDDEPFIRGGAIALPIAASLFATGLTMLIRRIKRRRALRREIHALESGALVSW